MKITIAQKRHPRLLFFFSHTHITTMADDFDDELYNVYNTVKEDSYGNTDIYGDDYKDALTGDEPQQESKEEPYDPSAATADPSPHRDDENKQQQQQQQYMGYSPQRQPQQPMMWGGFPPNMYQYAAYQRTLQQMANPYQMQQMFQRHFRQQQQQQQQQQQFQQQAGDEEGSRKPPPVASAANQDEG
ncbi:hypothetical protein BJV82DRAFT_398920 [Fennellomyces sp. T-0311]|nr:hypothetical protein BJV82DRAFT_398920 [Fennellomyces sp. T-0311]